MSLNSHAIAILRKFEEHGCRPGDILFFDKFGDAIVFVRGFIDDDEIRSALIYLAGNHYVVEYDAGLGVTAKGLAALK